MSLPRAAALALLLAVAASAQEKPGDSDLIHPRRAAPAAGLPLPRESSPFGTVLLFLGVGAAAAGGWLLLRRRAVSPAGVDRRLAIAETRSLGNRQYLVVADYEGKKYLLGVCPGRIELLTPLEGGAPRAS